MNREQWDAFISRLEEKWRWFAQQVMSRMHYVLNTDRVENEKRFSELEARTAALEHAVAQLTYGGDGAEPS